MTNFSAVVPVAELQAANDALELAGFDKLFQYNPDTGLLARRVTVSHNAKSGGVVGYKSSRRGGMPHCMQVRINGKLYKVHRVIWLLQTGKWPDGHIDHVDGDPFNNKWTNLRLATNSQNLQNRKAQRNSSTGISGVAPFGEKFRAFVTVDGKHKHLGLFSSLEDAANARKLAAKEHYGIYARPAGGY